ncbi:hypothetical protein B4U79_09303 [Dinothrombium tinctorium]|uniref:Cas1p 10 TM acyl transferase domain-containing protein n=1 Tax=Dinothrombium tinctorium TaxID=1965070 RepID=A0A3S3SIF0_9ACAR|nr:hypothetical protein B4U79_09303 [Dinothrombium tinctorium]
MSEESRASSESIKQRFNVTNAKKIVTVILLAFIAYHGILHLSYGIDSCKWLLSDGRFQGFKNWQPYGCMIHSYSKIDSRRCMRSIAFLGGNNYISFLGDSRIRQVYDAFVKLIATKEIPESKYAHHDLSFSEEDLRLKVEFIWRPVVNDSMLDVYEKWLKLPKSDRPKIIVTSSATWSIKSSNASFDELESYKRNLTRLLFWMDKMGESSQVLWMLQDPVYPLKLHPSRKMITNEQIDLYNKAAMDVLRYSKSDGVHIWSSSRLVSQGYNDDQSDGLHMGSVALNYAVQILLNMYCNDQMNHNDGTCCSDPEPITTLQIITFSIFGVFIVLAAGLIIHRKLTSNKPRWQLLINEDDENDNRVKENITKSYTELITTIAKLGLIMGYFFLCDRTNFFMKENKFYTHSNFFLPIAYVFSLGLFFTEESRFTSVLHRDQTNEWKGWMQLVILTYHMTRASQVLPIYMHIRLLVTSYLFLSGFGHFTYFWHTGDFGLHRLWQHGFKYFPTYWRSPNNGLRRLVEVLFRMNLLVVTLCLCMNKPYQFYYFVPLVSFWFLVIYFTMISIPRVTSMSSESNPIQYFYLILKFVVLFSLITILYMSEVFFEKIFLTRPWKALFVTTDDSIKEWWFRWKIDRYSAPLGMLFGFGYHLLKQYNILDDHNHGNLFSRGIALLATFASMIGILIYIGFAFACRNKQECNEIYPYISFIPVVSYVSLRNISGLLRSRYSAFFAWFGKISLELFICQYHIWLAADTYGVLVLVPSYPVLNVVMTAVIFVCIAHEINQITKTLAKYAISSDWRYMTRNLFIFLMILIPIGIKDGMF